jgi:hypothetical protein
VNTILSGKFEIVRMGETGKMKAKKVPGNQCCGLGSEIKLKDPGPSS